MSFSRGRLSFALVLIGIGAWQLAINISPQFHALAYGEQTWPLNIVGLGAFMALIGLLTWSPGWFIPACIIAGTGGILYYQNQSGDWSSWSYLWTLIPGFVAVGLFLLALTRWKRGPFIAAGWLMFACLVLFGVFASTLGGIPVAGAAGAGAVILLGILLLLSPVLKRRN